MDRARGPLLEQLSRARETNNFWFSQLQDLPYRPNLIQETTGATAEMKAIKPADIPVIARQYLRPENAWRAQVTPKAAGVAAGRGAPARRGAAS